MKVKLFVCSGAAGVAQLEEEVNEWLSNAPRNITVDSIQTAVTAFGGDKDMRTVLTVVYHAT